MRRSHDSSSGEALAAPGLVCRGYIAERRVRSQVFPAKPAAKKPTRRNRERERRRDMKGFYGERNRLAMSLEIILD
jgi:hypothetical protein